MKHPDFEAMTIEEIEDYRVKLREEMRDLRERIVASKEVYERKLHLRYLGARLRQDGLEHLSVADAKHLIKILNDAPREGDVVSSPDSANITAVGSDVEVN